MPAYTLRPATPVDVPAIFGLIRALADYERLLHEVTGDEETLASHLLGPEPKAEVVVGEVEGEVVGFALYFTNYSTFLTRPGLYLEDLFVLPAHRGIGLGKALLKHLAAIAVERGYGRFEWSVLDWNEPSLAFYRSQGAVPMDEWTVHRVSGEALRRLAAD